MTSSREGEFEFWPDSQTDLADPSSTRLVSMINVLEVLGTI
jgi:hypothetical protein